METPEKRLDSLGQENPARDLERKNLKEALERQDKKDKEAGGESPETPTENYDEKTVAELKELAQERGIHIGSDLRKDEIIETLEKG